MIKVSIVVPVYNVSTYITRCLSSIKYQTYKNLEVVFVDDCGDDDSVSQVESFIATSEMDCKLIHHEVNRGLSVARNTGVEAATGDYIFFMDSDDEITQDCIDQLVSPLKYYDYDVVCGNYITIGGEVQCELRLEKGAIIGNKVILDDFLNNKWYAMVWNKLYRRTFIRKKMLRFEEDILHEDELYSFQIALCADNMYVNTIQTYKYYVNPKSLMSSMTQKKHFNSWAIVLVKMLHSAKAMERYDDYNVYNYIEVLKSNLTAEAFKFLSESDFREYYAILNKAKWNPLKEFFKKRLSFKRALKDLCFYMPEGIGYFYLCIWYKLTSRSFIKDSNAIC